MKKIFVFYVFVLFSTLINAQTIYDRMDWHLKDKKININDAKKEGFAISFRNSDTTSCPYKVDFKKMKVFWREDISNNREKLFYFFDLEEKTVSVYNIYDKKYFYQIKRIKRKKDEVIVKISSKDEKIFISVNLTDGKFKEVRYDKNKNISFITEHGKVYMYPKN